jgi:hypothetical protein
MFGPLDLFTKRINDQIAEYAAALSDIARRLRDYWLDPFRACQPVKIRADRPVTRGAAQMPASVQRHPF